MTIVIISAKNLQNTGIICIWRSWAIEAWFTSSTALAGLILIFLEQTAYSLVE